MTSTPARNTHLLWWSEEGRHMRLSKQVDHKGIVIIGNDRKTACVTIERCIGIGAGKFQVEWHLNHSNGSVNGHIVMHEPELRRAFGLDNTITPSGLAFAKNHDLEVTTAEPGAYFRLGSMLALPNPGRREQGDPNICVYITGDIIAAVGAFLGDTKPG